MLKSAKAYVDTVVDKIFLSFILQLVH